MPSRPASTRSEHATLMDDDARRMMKARGVYMVPTLSALATTAACGTVCGIPASAVEKAKSMVTRHEQSFKKAHANGLCDCTRDGRGDAV